MTPPPPEEIELIPPVAERTVYRTMAIAVAIGIVPAFLGLIELGGTQYSSFVSTIRLILVAIAALVAATGLSMRPKLPLVWLLAFAVAVVVMFGLPPHWDSFRMLSRVLAVIAILGAALAAMPLNWRYGFLSAAAMVHFGSLLVATTWPDPAPWLSTQLAARVYMPYFRFMYLGNAYHFYSPEPGPANHLFVLIKYNVGGNDKPVYVYEWIDIPNRKDHFKDPLGMTYYRRLSLTELVSQSAPANITPQNRAKLEAGQLRSKAAVVSENGSKVIPIDLTLDSQDMQYRVAYPQLRGQILPSYAKHIASAYTAKDREVVSVKLFRVEHRVIPAEFFLNRYENGQMIKPGNSPFHPTTYRPYYYGEYNPQGELMNPLDPMLYWLVPIVPKTPLNDNENDYIDYMSDYAGAKFPWPQTSRSKQ
jgi:hypothetical protein